MGGFWQRWIVLVLVAGFTGCSAGNGTAGSAGDRLVLEVGGSQHSLRAALLAAGVRVEPAKGEGGDGGERTGDARSEGLPEPVQPDEPPPPPAAPAWFEVVLADGQTPIHLARKHLGDGNRFREILALNGWSEDDARRLRPGQKVRIPAAGASRAQDRR
jgi:nucleoid-associated protein YgaU